jgi:hypothetical protein
MAIYTVTNWTNGSGAAINANNLNKIEQGIFDCSELIDSISGDGEGNLVINGVETNVYTLPTADSETLGGVINSTDADNIISVDENGVIKATHPSNHDANMIILSTVGFNKNLDSSVSDVQKLADYINSFDISAAMLRKLRNGGI